MSSDGAPAQMVRGIVERFSDAAGYGFIRGTEVVDGEKRVDVFVHYSAIVGEGFRTLVPGEEVEYEPVQRLQGPAAIRVRRIRPGELVPAG